MRFHPFPCRPPCRQHQCGGYFIIDRKPFGLQRLAGEFKRSRHVVRLAVV